jgi:hypothetical protein
MAGSQKDTMLNICKQRIIFFAVTATAYQYGASLSLYLKMLK